VVEAVALHRVARSLPFQLVLAAPAAGLAARIAWQADRPRSPVSPLVLQQPTGPARNPRVAAPAFRSRHSPVD